MNKISSDISVGDLYLFRECFLGWISDWM